MFDLDKLSQRHLAMVIPLLAIIVIASFAGGLGVIFMLLYASALGKWGVIVLGMILIIGVPVVAYYMERKTEEEAGQH